MDAVRAQVYNLTDQVQQVPTQLLLAVACFSVLAFAILVSIQLNTNHFHAKHSDPKLSCISVYSSSLLFLAHRMSLRRNTQLSCPTDLLATSKHNRVGMTTTYLSRHRLAVEKLLRAMPSSPPNPSSWSPLSCLPTMKSKG